MYEASISTELFQCHTFVAIDMSSSTTQRPSVISMLVFAWKRPECNHSFMDCLVTDLHPTVLYTCCDCCLSSCVAVAVTVAVVVDALVGFVEAVFYRVFFTSIKPDDKNPNSVRRRCYARSFRREFLSRPNVCHSIGIITLTSTLL